MTERKRGEYFIMIIINAVECTQASTLQNIASSYLVGNSEGVIYTDDLQIKSYIDSVYNDSKCIYNEALVALWLRIIVDNALLIITDINNVCSGLYVGLNKNYTIVCIEQSSIGAISDCEIADVGGVEQLE